MLWHGGNIPGHLTMLCKPITDVHLSLLMLFFTVAIYSNQTWISNAKVVESIKLAPYWYALQFAHILILWALEMAHKVLNKKQLHNEGNAI
jgi:hypothetical protein